MTDVMPETWPGMMEPPREFPTFSTRYDIAPVEPFRILVTGWRFWPIDDQVFIHEALWMVWTKHCFAKGFLEGTMSVRPCIVVDGFCPYGGVDTYASEWAMQQSGFGVRSERHAAETVGGRFRGPERNTHMVGLGAHFALAFPGPDARGTIDCMKKIITAGIRMMTLPYQNDTIRAWRNTGRIEFL